MGFVLSKLFPRLFGGHHMRVIIVGLCGAGKSTTLFKLRVGPIFSEFPAPGFGVDTTEYKNVKIAVFDVDAATRPFWKLYYPNTKGIIFVVDSNDRERIDKAQQELLQLLREDELKGSALLVFANKQDLPNAMSMSEITTRLQLHSIHNHTWHIQPTCATSGDGLFEGFQWLSDELLKQH